MLAPVGVLAPGSVQGKHNDHNFDFFLKKMRKNEKCLELPDLARKLIKKGFKKFASPHKKIVFLREKRKVLRIASFGQ